MIIHEINNVMIIHEIENLMNNDKINNLMNIHVINNLINISTRIYLCMGEGWINKWMPAETIGFYLNSNCESVPHQTFA